MNAIDSTQCLQVGVVGAGAWGTALSDQLARKGHSVTLWCYEPEVAQELRDTGINQVYLPGHHVKPSIRFTTDLGECVRIPPNCHMARVCGESWPAPGGTGFWLEYDGQRLIRH